MFFPSDQSYTAPISGPRRRGDAWTAPGSVGEMPALPCRRKLRPAQPTKKFGLKRTENRKFRIKHKLADTGKTSVRQQLGSHLKDIEMPAYSEICSKSQSAAKKYLQQHGVLLKNDKEAVCSSPVTTQTSWRCSRRTCDVRAKFTNTLLSYTPLFLAATRGFEPDYAMFLKECYLLGCKVANDSAVHLARNTDQSYNACRHKIDDFFPRLKLILAWQNAVDAEKIHFNKEFVETLAGLANGSARLAHQLRTWAEPL